MAADGYLFGGGIADFVVVSEETTGELTLGAGTPVWFYNARMGGTRITTGLTDLSGVPITAVTSDSNGAIPQLRGPTGVAIMWADASGGEGPRFRVEGVLADQVLDLATRVGSLEPSVADLASAPAWVRRDPATGAWPARPSTGRWCLWVDTLPETPSPPAIGGTGMVDGLDMYWGSA